MSILKGEVIKMETRMFGAITHQQKLSMTHAKQGIKLLRSNISKLDALDSAVSSTVTERNKYKSSFRERTGKEELEKYMKERASLAPLRLKVEEAFRSKVVECAEEIRNSKTEIFSTCNWSGRWEQEKNLDRAISRVSHCGGAIRDDAPQEIISSALAEAKDSIELVISFLKTEAKRYPAKVTDAIPADIQSIRSSELAEVDNSRTRKIVKNLAKHFSGTKVKISPVFPFVSIEWEPFKGTK